MIRTILLAIGMIAFASMSAAESRVALGYGRLVNNDAIGEWKDRWQTGSVVGSHVRGFRWSGSLPENAGDILEYRVYGGIISPESIITRGPGDRPFAGTLAFGVHTHFAADGNDVSLGGDLSIVGPQTRLDDVQTFLHDTFSYPALSDSVRAAQIGNGVYPGVVAEVGREINFTGNIRLRPFGEMRIGPEILFRAGADLAVGRIGTGGLLLRDQVTGQRYVAIDGQDTGMSLVLGGDTAFVAHSVYLPASRGFELTPSRNRLRAGLHWRGEGRALFYGLTWLGKEFEGQSEGQLVGSIRLQLDF